MKQRLRKLLDELHTELADADEMDTESREQLLDLASTIAAVADDEPAETPNQLEQTVLELEAEHPRIAGVLSQIADTLSKLGI